MLVAEMSGLLIIVEDGPGVIQVAPEMHSGLLGYADNRGKRSGLVTKRYSDFVALKESLEKNNKGVSFRGFPRKHMFRNGESVIEERKIGLDRFLKDALRGPGRRDRTLHEFLDLQVMSPEYEPGTSPAAMSYDDGMGASTGREEVPPQETPPKEKKKKKKKKEKKSPEALPAPEPYEPQSPAQRIMADRDRRMTDEGLTMGAAIEAAGKG